ncbi:MAG: ATP-binding protein [Thermoplasmata archaeon]|nr:ATP-binding protein [Thermoplasmata archaeon]
MPVQEFPSAVLRAFAALGDGSGRTLVIAGPPLSGKSRLLAAIQAQARGVGARVYALQASYRDRTTPLATVSPLQDSPASAELDEALADGETSALPDVSPYVPDVAPVESRRRRGPAARSSVGAALLGVPARARSAASLDAATYWERLVAGFRDATPTPVTILVEDAALADSESREFLLYLSERARLRPLLVVLVLDSSLAANAIWEERLLARADVDWVKFTQANADAREARKVRENFLALPARTQKIVGFAALMGGNVSEVNLSRVAREGFRALAESLLPGTEVRLVKVAGGRVMVVPEGASTLIAELLTPEIRAEMHREIAEALSALNPEPILSRRLEIANNFFEWNRGPSALRFLLEAAELSERLTAYDTVAEVLDKALACVPSLPPLDRPEAEAELRFFRTRILIFCGRVAEAQHELAEGLNVALGAKVERERLEEWLESVVPAVRAAGPRPSMITLLGELADRCHDAGATGSEVLIVSLVTELELARGRTGAARTEANRAARLARKSTDEVTQGLALFAVGLSRLNGTPPERALARKFLHSAALAFRSARRFALERQVEEIRLRELPRDGDRKKTLAAWEAGIAASHRPRNLLLELYYTLGFAETLLEGTADGRLDGALKRAREIAEQLHLMPPSPLLLRLWLAEGGSSALCDDARARERFEAVADLGPALAPPNVRAGALAHLLTIAEKIGDPSVVESIVERLKSAENAAALRSEWHQSGARSAKRPFRSPAQGSAPETMAPSTQERGDEGWVESVDNRDDGDSE